MFRFNHPTRQNSRDAARTRCIIYLLARWHAEPRRPLNYVHIPFPRVRVEQPPNPTSLSRRPSPVFNRLHDGRAGKPPSPTDLDDPRRTKPPKRAVTDGRTLNRQVPASTRAHHSSRPSHASPPKQSHLLPQAALESQSSPIFPRIPSRPRQQVLTRYSAQSEAANTQRDASQ